VPEDCAAPIPEVCAAPVELPGGGRVLFTTRAEGNLATFMGPEAELGRDAREVLRGRWGWSELVHARQVHGRVVQRVGEETVAQADGHVVRQRGVAAMVLVADCLPIALGSPDAVAILHAGWRGLAAGVVESGVQALRGVGLQREIVAVIGPGAGACCYEVGEEVHGMFAGAHRHGRNLDLRAIARARLRAAGVRDIADLTECTICSPRYFSHRRQGDAAGRQAGVVWRLD
jgi:YfiH family protein